MHLAVTVILLQKHTFKRELFMHRPPYKSICGAEHIGISDLSPLKIQFWAVLIFALERRHICLL